MLENIRWLGHDTFRIEGQGLVIYTDPFQIKREERADLILITHEHRDHCSPDDIAKLCGPETSIVTVSDCLAKISPEGVTIVRPGDKLTVRGIEIEAVPAYNTNKQFHTEDRRWVGYIFTVDGKRIYLAGDTDRIPEMKSLGDIDIALLPVSGTYVMTAEEAVQAALDINPRLAVPMHFGSIVGEAEDALRFAEGLKGKIAVTIMKEE